MPRVTRRGAAVLVAAVPAYALGEWAGYPVLRALAGAGLGVVLAALVITARRPRVVVTRAVYPDRVRRGKPAFARLAVRNPTAARQGGFDAGDRVGVGFHAVAVRALPPGAQAVYHYELPTLRRGRFTVGPLTLQRVDPFGLAVGRLTTGDTTTMWVHPAVHPVRAVVGGHPRHHHEGTTTDDSLRGSTDLRDVREYVPGDEVRLLHWKATARTGTLMVREYVDPEQPRFTAVLDTRADLVDPERFEEAVDLAASLLAAAAAAGHRCRLVTPGGLDVGVHGGGQGAVRPLLDELCLLDREPGTVPLVPGTFARSDKGGLLVVVLCGARQDDLSLIAALRSGYASAVVVVVGSSVDVPVPGVRVLRADDARSAVRRWNEVVAS
ncbi:DUF58 domain-containing protein [Actinokineospora bangkokensis]|uniref:DUF58 domain-containing protein n=1 Tax=Actinokineospora bangkokensis TaxID=1193682 RepID=A0A1Q9LTD2_9PSEU|nr:DUF58 domain-containing protein [Actinokineospora bangkokensis]OLR95288.1 hypothetical protein BJP25_07340 [Actinokineospora bangkokensis]